MGASLALMTTTSLTGYAMAQTAEDGPFAFSFDAFSERMRTLASTPYSPVAFNMPERFATLSYDDYRRIQYRLDKGKWAELNEGFQIMAFHIGWLFKEPIKVFEIVDGKASKFAFTADDFEYHNPDVETANTGQEFPGIAGFKINYPINKPGKNDELVSFVGASYFRALGRENLYGLSSRGLVINSWLDGPEEFPRFSEFYLERPTNSESVVLYAALESQSVTGAYRFEITPGNDKVQETVMDVTARLYFRADIRELGVAPLTSMFLYADNNRSSFDDFRPQVHDSNGLLVENEAGEVMWRPLNNTPSIGNSYLWQNNPHAFGLYQRERNFDAYQDAGAHYERRPSVRVEPIGEWGQGHVRLIEIPSRLEADDNIGAFWIPSDPIKAGDTREFHYRMLWGNLNPKPESTLAYVLDTRAGRGGVSGVDNADNLRKFVIDFKGGELENLDPEAQLEIVADVSGGQLKVSTLSKIADNNVWRLVLDVEVNGAEPIELKAFVTGFGRTLTETWLYQWRASA
jgi:glucans biosynthesis protein